MDIEASASHFCSTASDMRIGDTDYPQASENNCAVQAGDGHGTSTDIEAIARAVRLVLWEQRRVSAAQETTAAVVNEILSLLRCSSVCIDSRTAAGTGNCHADRIQQGCTFEPAVASNKLMQESLDAESYCENQPVGTAAAATCCVDRSVSMDSLASAKQLLCSVDYLETANSQSHTNYSCLGTGCLAHPFFSMIFCESCIRDKYRSFYFFKSAL